MDNNSHTCLLVKFKPSPQYSAELIDFLDQWFETSALNYGDDGQEEYVGYTNTNFNPDILIHHAAEMKIQLPEFSTEQLAAKNWLKESVIKFDPIETAGFCIYGIHEHQPPQTDKLSLKVYAATAFGSGHQTTKSCLNALSYLNSTGVRHQKILDIGTGSGILSLACALLWHKTNPVITAVDIDEEAVRVTKQNAMDNHLEQYLDIGLSDGYHSEKVRKNAPYDIIIANILARPLIDMAPDLAKHLKPGGFCVLSGFVDNQVDWVVNAHTQTGLKLIKDFCIDNWHAVLMEKTL